MHLMQLQLLSSFYAILSGFSATVLHSGMQCSVIYTETSLWKTIEMRKVSTTVLYASVPSSLSPRQGPMAYVRF